MLGKIDYKVIDEDEALMDITVFIDEHKFRNLMNEKKKENYMFFIIDKSGSMCNEIDNVRNCAKKCIEKHFNKNKNKA